MRAKRYAAFLIRQILYYAITLYVSFTVIFFLLRLIPGNPIRIFQETIERSYGGTPFSDEVIEWFVEAYGIKDDIFTQYVKFFQRSFEGASLGPSFIAFPTPVEVLIRQRLPWSIVLLGTTTIVAWIIGIIIGTLVGLKRETKISDLLFSLMLVLSQIPSYILAIALLLLLAYVIPIFPPRGGYSPTVELNLLDLKFILSAAYHAFLPALSIILVSVCGWILSTRALTINILGEDYLLLAQAKGLRKSRILIRYILRNLLLPQTTGLMLSLGGIVTGSFLVEWVFNYPGIGSLFSQAIAFRDYNVIQGITLLTMTSVLTANLMIDLLYPLIDPRVLHEEVGKK
jgi:peptide/nickel transport system permease protein